MLAAGNCVYPPNAPAKVRAIKTKCERSELQKIARQLQRSLGGAALGACPDKSERQEATREYHSCPSSSNPIAPAGSREVLSAAEEFGPEHDAPRVRAAVVR